MKLSSTGPKAAREKLRERWRQSRAAARSLADAFPALESIRIELRFTEEGTRAPVPQVHVLHPPANAFFEFPCPYAGCEGQIDLTPAVGAAVAKAAQQIEGGFVCNGERAKDATGRQPCRLHLDYTVDFAYRPGARP